VAANKIDVPEARERAEAFVQELQKRKIVAHLVSGATGEGIPALLDATVLALDRAPVPAPLERDVNPLAPVKKKPKLESDERQQDTLAREERAPPLTGRQKDGVFKATAAAREKRGKKTL
jgi:GTP-binding protein